MHSRAANCLYGPDTQIGCICRPNEAMNPGGQNARPGDQRIDWHQGLTDIFEAWMLSRSGRLSLADLWPFLPKLGGATAPPFFFLGGTVISYRAHRLGLDACYAGRLQIDEPSVLGRVRKATDIFASSIAAGPAVDSLSIAGSDLADIDVVTGSEKLRDWIGIPEHRLSGRK